jgi:DNA-binding CsgD family transcriptional regulator
MNGGLLERETALLQLERGVGEARRRRGLTVVVWGSGGVGKSTLLRLAAAMSGAEGLRVLTARGGELEAEFPFGVVRQLFDRVHPSAPDPGGNSSPTQRIFGPAAAGDDSLVNHTALRALFSMVVRLAEEQPLAVFVDDAHWADPASLRFIDYLTRRLEELPVLVVLGARDTAPAFEEQMQALRSIDQAQWIRLEELSISGTEQLLTERLESKPASAFVDEVYELTGGNPFLIWELAEEVSHLALEPTAASVTRLRTLAPASVSGPLGARLHRLGESCSRVVEAAAVLGEAPVRLVATLAGLTVDEAGVAADRLAEAGVFSRSAHPAFRHPLLRTAVLESLPHTHRSRLHREAAVLLREEGAEPARVAAQLLHVEPVRDQAVVRVLRAAAIDSMRRGSPDSAVAFLRRALEEMDREDPERPVVMLELGSALSPLDPMAGADVLAEAASSATDIVVRARAALGAGNALCTAGRVVEGLQLVESHLRTLPYGGEADLRDLARLSAVLQWTVGTSSSEALQASARYWEWADSIADEAPVVAAGRAYVECVTVGNLERARNLAKTAADEEGLVRRLQPGDFVAMGAIAALIATDELGVARSLGHRLREEAVRSGEPTVMANCRMWSSWADVAYGDLVSAEADAETALTIARATGQYVGVPIATLAAVLVERGEAARAAALFDDADIDLTGLVHRQDTTTLIARAGVWLSIGRFAEAAADLERLEVEARERGDRNPLLGWRALRAMSLAATGRGQEAREMAAENVATARHWGAPRSVASALRVAARLEPDSRVRLDLLREAGSIVEASQSQLERSKVEVALGSELRRQGQRIEAREWLRPGYERADRCGAVALAEFALAEMVAAGARPRRRYSEGPESLTPSERRVAEMVAAGMTNREIAEALYISLKTVSFHLSSCYRKLGVSTREKLATVIDLA